VTHLYPFLSHFILLWIENGRRHDTITTSLHINNIQFADDSLFTGRGYLLKNSENGTGEASGTQLYTPFRQCHPAGIEGLARRTFIKCRMPMNWRASAAAAKRACVTAKTPGYTDWQAVKT
jgi:hypothetical protein